MIVSKHPIAATYIGQHGQPVTRVAYIALRAAELRSSIGAYAARQYFLRHSGQHSLRLYRIACQLRSLHHWSMERISSTTGDSHAAT